MPRTATISDWLKLLALTVLWGSSFAANEVALAALSPSALVGARLAIAAAVLCVYLRALGMSLPRSRGSWLHVSIMALFGNLLPFSLVACAQPMK